MHRPTAYTLALATAVLLASAPAHAQVPVASNNTLVSVQPTTDAGSTAASLPGLRAWLSDLLQSRTWLNAASAPVPSRASRAARLRRAASTRTQTWVP